MNPKLITQIGKSQRLKIINALKRTQGLSVRELSGRLGASYMGIKQHCLSLQEDGFLDVWRRPAPVGRPELLYRLTPKAHELFPTTSNQTTLELLDAAAQLYGPAAPEKLLYSVFQKKTDKYRTRLRGETLKERALSLVKLRDEEGYMAELETEAGLWIVEHHNPIWDLAQAYPLVNRLETDLIQRLLRVEVEREEKSVSGLYCCVFRLLGS